MDDIVATFNPNTLSISEEQTMPELSEMDPTDMQTPMTSMTQDIDPFTSEDLESIEKVEGVAMLCQLIGNHLMTKAFGVGIIDLTFQYIAMGIIVSLVVSVIAGWFPARQAAKLDPVESLRYE